MSLAAETTIARERKIRKTGGEQGPGDHGKEAAKKSQAHTTNGTRARGRRELGQKPRSHTGPVVVIDEAWCGDALWIFCQRRWMPDTLFDVSHASWVRNCRASRSRAFGLRSLVFARLLHVRLAACAASMLAPSGEIKMVTELTLSAHVGIFLQPDPACPTRSPTRQCSRHHGRHNLPAY